MRDGDRDRLTAFGFDDDTIDALELLWEHDEIGPLLGPTANEFRLMGWHLVDGYDAAYHGLHPDDAMFYFKRGLSGHHAHILNTHPHAEANLCGNRTNAELDAILAANIPRDVLLNALLAATSPEDTDAYLRRYQAAATGTPETHGPSPDTTASIAREVATLGGLRANPPHCCA